MSEKTKYKRIQLMTNFGINIWPKTITEAVWDVERNKYLSEILSEIEEGTFGPGGPMGNSAIVKYLTEPPITQEPNTVYIIDQPYETSTDGFYENVNTGEVVPIPFESEVFGRYPWVTIARRVKIPTGVKTISSDAFTGANILEINIPNTVELIEENAFNNLEELSRIIVHSLVPPNSPNLGDVIGYGWGGVVLSMPKLSEDLYRQHSAWSRFFGEGDRFYIRPFVYNANDIPNKLVINYLGQEFRTNNIISDVILDDHVSAYRLNLDLSSENDNIEIELLTPVMDVYNLFLLVDEREPNTEIITINKVNESFAENYETPGEYYRHITYETSTFEVLQPVFNLFYGTGSLDGSTILSKINVINRDGISKYIDIETRRYFNSPEESGPNALCIEVQINRNRMTSQTNLKIKHLTIEAGIGLPVGTRITVRRK